MVGDPFSRFLQKTDNEAIQHELKRIESRLAPMPQT
jgi:hypothetical protein